MQKRDGREYLIPDWPAHERVQACTTTRIGGVGSAPYDSFNLADHVGDAPASVEQNRHLLRQDWHLPSAPVWLTQIHGRGIVDLPTSRPLPCEADASFTAERGVVCAVLTADCLPLLFSDPQGRAVAAVHAGWRGLAAGVIEAMVEHYLAAVSGLHATDLLVWLGPAIGPDSFEVGRDVQESFTARYRDAAQAFRETGQQSWYADIYRLARLALAACGVDRVYGGEWDTCADPRFYSYRRDRQTGRMASLIWRN
jgi:YfiH family protein